MPSGAERLKEYMNPVLGRWHHTDEDYFSDIPEILPSPTSGRRRWVPEKSIILSLVPLTIT
jgi:hypothetical protein